MDYRYYAIPVCVRRMAGVDRGLAFSLGRFRHDPIYMVYLFRLCLCISMGPGIHVLGFGCLRGDAGQLRKRPLYRPIRPASFPDRAVGRGHASLVDKPIPSTARLSGGTIGLVYVDVRL